MSATTLQNKMDLIMARAVFCTCVKIIQASTESSQSKNKYKYSERNFHEVLRKCPDCKDLTDEQGYNLLILVILERRVEFLEPLFYCGILFDMLDIKINHLNSERTDKSIREPHTSDHGLTAKDIINKYNIKNIEPQLENFKKLEESMTELHKSARSGNANAVRTLLAEHPEMMDMRASDGSNCFMWAVTSGNLEVVKIIFAAGGKYQTKTNLDETPLGRATYLGYTDIIVYLITELAFNPDEACKRELTPASIAIGNADLEVLKVLVQCKATITNKLLPHAARTGRIDLWRFVYWNITNVDIDYRDENGRTPLHIAVANGYIDIAKDIIQKNGCLLQKDLAQRSVLFAAIDSRNTNTFKFIIDKLKSKGLLEQLINEQDIYCRQKLSTVIGRDNGIIGHHFVKVHRVFQELFDKRVQEGGELDVAFFGDIQKSGLGTPTGISMENINESLNFPLEKPDMTPLHYAILHRQTEMALILIKEGADVNKKDYFGNQLIHIAAMRGDMEVIKTLEDYGIDYESHGELNKTPEDIAEINRHYDLAKYFEGKTQNDNKMKVYCTSDELLLNDNDDQKQLSDFEDDPLLNKIAYQRHLHEDIQIADSSSSS